MSFLFTCPHCQTQTQVEDRYSGQSGECVTCGGKIKVPLFAATDGVGTEQGRPMTWLAAVGAMIVILCCLVFLIFRFSGDTVKRLSANRIRNSSIKNLEKIAAALNAYANDYGKYPPPAIVDANNKPLLSWRVLILPYLGEDSLYSQFDLTKAHDAPQNANMIYMMPDVFKHPASVGNYPTESDYYLIVGRGTLFPKSGPLGPNDVLDSPSQTILVAEGDPNVMTAMWTEPVDLEFGAMTGQINGGVDDLGGNLMEDGTAMVTVDGRGHFLPITTSPSDVNSMISPRGGEPLKDSLLD